MATSMSRWMMIEGLTGRGSTAATRQRQAPDPASLCLDPRCDADQIRFVQELAQQLIWRDAADSDLGTEAALCSEETVDWQGFCVSSDLHPEQIAAFTLAADDQTELSEEQRQWLGRPHFALLLTFIRLLRHQRELINRLPARDLQNYYENRLGFTLLNSEPDRVTVSFTLLEGAPPLLLKAGSLLLAGTTNQGEERHYRTLSDLSLNHTRITSLRSLQLHRGVTDLETIQASEPDARARLNAMLAFVYRDSCSSNVPATTEQLVGILPWLNFCQETLKLEIEEFLQLMSLVHECTDTEAEQEWDTVNRWLGVEGLLKNRVLEDRHDFARNLNTSLVGPGGSLDFQADALSEVNSLDDLYLTRDLPEVQAFLASLFTAKTCLLEPTPEDERTDPSRLIQARLHTFERVMTWKRGRDAKWQQVNWLLERSGRRIRQLPSWRLDPGNPNSCSAAFATNLTLTLGGEAAASQVTWPGTTADPRGETPDPAGHFETLYRELNALRDQWALPLEKLRRLCQRAAQVLEDRSNRTATTWQEIRQLLCSAHEGRWLSARREALAKARQGTQGGKALLATLQQALASPEPEDGRASAAAAEAQPQQSPSEELSVASGLEQLGAWLPTGAQKLLGDFNEHLLAPVPGQRSLSWREVDALLERAQRARDGQTAPPLERVDWRLVVGRQQTIDPKAMAAGESLEPCFQSSAAGQAPSPGAGFVVASRLLGLAEGSRQITLCLRFSTASGSLEALATSLNPPLGQALKPHSCAGVVPDLPDQPGWGLNQALLVDVTTAAGWWVLPIQKASLEDGAESTAMEWSLTLQLALPPSAPALEPMAGADLPRLRLRLRPFGGSEEAPWRTCTGLDGLRLTGARLQVSVEGLKGVRLEQEGGTPLDPSEPFTPFGSSPMVGSSLLLSHSEILDGDLESLRFQGRWQKMPADLEAHYSAYRGWPGLEAKQAVKAGSFTMEVDLLDQEQGILQKQLPLPLFTPARGNGTPDLLDVVCLFNQSPPSGPAPPRIAGTGELRQQKRVWRWRLKPMDFGHGLYPSLVARRAQELAIALSAAAGQQSLALAAAMASSAGKGAAAIRESYEAAMKDAKTGVNAADYAVPIPYTPLLADLEVSYSRVQDLGACKEEWGQLRRVDLFENEEPLRLPPPPQPESPTSHGLGPVLMLSQDYAAELHVALEGAQPGQPLTMAFQLAEGSAHGPRPDPAVVWEVQRGWSWLPLPVREDGTDGLLHSGIVRVSLPDELETEGHAAEKLWIRARLRGAVQAYATLQGLQTQAVEAEGVVQEEETASGDGPLPPHTITELVEVVPEIAAIHQPFSSRPGRGAETEAQQAIRVAELLRHKGRALSGWDYERLLWERFANQLHAVVCLPTTEAQRVELVVIPNLLQQVPRNPFAPGAATDQLEAMGSYLRQRCPPELTLVVRNAHYVHVKVRLWVCLQEGVDPAWAERQLQEKVIRTLSAWCFDAMAEARLGGEVRASDLVAAIDPLPFVAYLERLMLFLVDPGGKPLRMDDRETSSPDRLQAPGADVVLIASASQAVEFVPPGAAPLPSLIGIGAVRIGLDFQLA
jgi:hypothetical protein